MTYTTLDTLTTGDPIPATQWNLVRDNQEWVAKPPTCTLTRTTRWTATGNNYGPFTAATVDTHGFWNQATAPEKATVPTGCAGTYLITGWHQHSAGGVTAPGGGALAPGATAMTPRLIDSVGSAFSMLVDSSSIESPYSFTLLYPLVEGDSIVLLFGVSPVNEFGLTLEWMRP